MIVTVTPNPAIDVTIEATTIEPGASHVIPAATRRAGGKGLNVARVLAQTGHRVVALGPVGADDREWFARDLDGVDARLTACASGTRSTFALVETALGRTTQLNERGRSRTPAEWTELVGAARTHCGAATCLTVSGSLPPDSPDDLVAGLCEAGRTAGVPVVADLTGPALVQAARAGVAVVKPNRDELRATVGSGDPVAGARALHAHGARLVLVSLGGEGLVAVPRTGPALRARLDAPLHGNATGAGDAAVAAVAAALDDGLDLRRDLADILRRAAAWSAAAVLARLAGSIDPAHTDLAARVRITAMES